MDPSLHSAAELCSKVELGGDVPRPGELPALLVDLDSPVPDTQLPASWAVFPRVLIGVGPRRLHSSQAAALVDLCVEPNDAVAVQVMETVERHPVAATALAVLLRSSEGLEPTRAVALESATYSALQGGADFRGWLAQRDRARHAPSGSGSRVRTEIGGGGIIHVVLQRVDRHNAIDRRMRLELHDALRAAGLARARWVVMRADGPSFSSGGDLDEFGTFDDTGGSHLARLSQHPALAMIDLGPKRIGAVVHGHVFGGGLELAAFAGRLVAHPDATFRLPEVGLGLVPGAGGTASVPRRIGRHRTNLLALSGATLSAPEALSWGLVDALDADPAVDPSLWKDFAV